jgi:hypothetical protein
VLGGSIAMRAAQEYTYVARDMRRILIIAGGLTLFLIGLWLVTTIGGIQLG